MFLKKFTEIRLCDSCPIIIKLLATIFPNFTVSTVKMEWTKTTPDDQMVLPRPPSLSNILKYYNANLEPPSPHII